MKLAVGNGVKLITHVRAPNEPWKICITDAMLEPMVQWYHVVMSHIGMQRPNATMQLHFYHRNLRVKCEDLVGQCGDA